MLLAAARGVCRAGRLAQALWREREAAMQPSTSPDATTATPEPIIRTVNGIIAAQNLMVANEVGLFEQLGDETLTAEELAERTKLPFRSVRILADALVAGGLLDKDESRYRNSLTTATFLSGRGPDLRPYVRMAHKVGYPAWETFEDAIRGGGGAQSELFHVSDETQRIMSDGIGAMTGLGAAALAGAYDFGRFERFLDVAGGAGIHLQTILDRYPQLRGTLVELPPVAAQARQRLQPQIDAGRADVVDGDIFEEPLPGGHDLVLLAHTLHLFTPEPNKELLRRIQERVDSGTRLLLVDFWTNPEHTEPGAAALLAGEFYRISGGEAYSVEQAHDWLAQTGWQFLGHQPLAGPESLVEAEAEGDR